MNIKLVDTITQYHEIKEQIDSSIMNLLEKGQYIGGEAVKNFENQLSEYLKVKHVISCANGTDALQVALMVLGAEPGDEILTPSFTYIATVEVIALLRLKPVFVEVYPDTFNMDTEDLKRKIGPKTKGIIPVHLYGQPAQMENILKIAKENHLFVIEDTAQAIGSEITFSDGSVHKSGTLGEIGCTSFYPSKNLGAYGDGGAIFTNDDTLAEKIRMICNHGQKKRYYHDSIGINSRLDAIQAAILSVKLPHLDRYNTSRAAAAALYNSLLADTEGLILPSCAPDVKHVYHQYTLKITQGRAKRDAVKAYLDARSIPNMIYYPVASHLQSAYEEYGYREGDLPITEQLTAEVLSLPMHSELPDEQIRFICDNLKAALKETTV